MTGLGLPDFVMAKSADDIMVVVLVAVLLLGVGSVSLADTLAELIRIPEVAGLTVTTMVIVVLLPLPIDPRLQVIEVVSLQPVP